MPESRTLSGYAAIFGSLSEDLGGYREQIAPGAFSKSLPSGDVRALWNHDPRIVLGRSSAGTLRLTEDATGLAVSIDLPSWAEDYVETIRRGDVTQMSFGFETIKDHWQEVKGEVRRTLLEVRIMDVSCVAFPAYTATSVAVRGAQRTLAQRRVRLEAVRRRLNVQLVA